MHKLLCDKRKKILFEIISERKNKKKNKQEKKNFLPSLKKKKCL